MQRHLLPAAYTAAVLLAVAGLGLSAAKRVIFMPFPIASHAILHVQLARAVLDKGHEVWLVLPATVLLKGVINTTGLSVLEYHTTYDVEQDIANEFFLKAFLAGEAYSGDTNEKFLGLSHEILSNESLYKELRNVEADLFVFDDDLAIGKMFVVFPYRLGVPFACVDFSFQPFFRRVPFSSATSPAFMSGLHEHMNLRERLQNTVIHFLQLVLGSPWLRQDVVARYAPEMSYVPLDVLVARAQVWLIQLDPILFHPYPTLPNVKHIGGMAATPPQPLTSQFQSFMDRGKAGVVVVSFGSMVVNLPQNIVEKLMKSFAELHPMKVVFRINATSPNSDQILTTMWLPQNALLAHPNCRVFVTHCGLNSLYQALYHAVPMLGLPLFYDQQYNCETMQLKGFGVKMDIRHVDVHDLVDAIKKLNEDSRYKSTITKASLLFKEVYGIPVKTAAYWLDHVMRYGGEYMKSAGQEMPMYQFLMLDVLGILVGIACILVVITGFCVRQLVKRVCKSYKAKVKED